MLRARVVSVTCVLISCTSGVQGLDGGPRDAQVAAAEPDATADDGSSPLDIGFRGTEVAAYCASVLRVKRAKQAECFGGDTSDLEEIDRERGIDAECAATGGAVDEGRLEFSATAADECVAFLGSIPCVDWAALYERANTHAHPTRVAQCADVFRGRQMVGDFCAASIECRRESVCDNWSLDTTGLCSNTCVLTTIGKPGDQCDNALLRCAHGLLCQRGVCGSAIPVGQQCRFDGVNLACVPSARCDSYLGVCVARPSFGEACEVVVEGPSHFDPCSWAGLWCSTASAGASCSLGRRVDESCSRFERCGAGLVCVQATGRCRPQALRDERCSNDSECVSLRCHAGVCLPRSGLGEPCADSSDCSAGTQCDGLVCTDQPWACN